MPAPSPPRRALLPLEAARDSPAVPSDAAADLAAITGLVEEEEELPDSRDEAEESDEVEMEGARPGETPTTHPAAGHPDAGVHPLADCRAPSKDGRGHLSKARRTPSARGS